MKILSFLTKTLSILLICIWGPAVSAQSAWHNANDQSNQEESNGQPSRIGGGSFRNNRGIDPQQIQAGQNAQAAIILGEGLLKVGKVEEAIHSFQTAINYEHTDGLAYQRLAEAYTAAGQLDKAVDTYRKVMYNRLGPGVGNIQGSKVEVLMQFALLLQRTNHIEEAVTAYRRGAYLLNYRDSENHEGKPYLKVMLPTFGSGGDIPYTPQRLQALAHIAIAIETFSFGDKEALAHLREAARLYPDSPVAHFYLGEQLHRMQNREAKSAYAKAAALGDDRVGAAAQEALKGYH